MGGGGGGGGGKAKTAVPSIRGKRQVQKLYVATCWNKWSTMYIAQVFELLNCQSLRFGMSESVMKHRHTFTYYYGNHLC